MAIKFIVSPFIGGKYADIGDFNRIPLCSEMTVATMECRLCQNAIFDAMIYFMDSSFSGL